MVPIETWPGSIVQQHLLIDAIGKYLRTHGDGGKRLMEWLESMPPDRTEEEYRELRRAEAERTEAAVRNAIGLPPLAHDPDAGEERTP